MEGRGREATAIRINLFKVKHLLRIAVASLPLPLLRAVILNEVKNLILFYDRFNPYSSSTLITPDTMVSYVSKWKYFP